MQGFYECVQGELFSMENFSIRKVTRGDENILAYIQTESWKAAFKGIISDGLLEECTDINRATEMYRKLLARDKGNGYILEVEGRPHCIAYWDASREKDLPGYAELICIHSLQDKWRAGYGSRMMDKIFSDVKNAGYSKMMLWVFTKNNRAISFYKAKGFKASDRIQPSFGTTEIMFVKELVTAACQNVIDSGQNMKNGNRREPATGAGKNRNDGDK